MSLNFCVKQYDMRNYLGSLPKTPFPLAMTGCVSIISFPCAFTFGPQQDWLPALLPEITQPTDPVLSLEKHLLEGKIYS